MKKLLISLAALLLLENTTGYCSQTNTTMTSAKAYAREIISKPTASIRNTKKSDVITNEKSVNMVNMDDMDDSIKPSKKDTLQTIGSTKVSNIIHSTKKEPVNRKAGFINKPTQTKVGQATLKNSSLKELPTKTKSSIINDKTSSQSYYSDYIALAKKEVIDIEGKINQAFFPPDENEKAKATLIGLIANEKKLIQITLYDITDNDTTDAIIDAYYRGIGVEVVADENCLINNHSTLLRLYNASIPIHIRVNEKPKHGKMHDKFIVFSRNFDNKSVLWTGSFNFSYAAQHFNDENIVILENTLLIKKYKDNFVRLQTKYQPLLDNRFLTWYFSSSHN